MTRWIAGALALLAIAGLIALGVWQLERRTWKLALIAQVERRLAAAPISAPRPAEWQRIGRDDAYTRVKVRGVFAEGRETLVQAATALGAGYWVLTPLVTDRGFTVLVNRGFVPPEGKIRRQRLSGEVTITGLLRVSEPGGGFLRHNDPVADRWYSRDVAAISAKRGLNSTAPYFIDADAASEPGSPRGGLTVIAFANNHLQYALTWFVMAAMLAAASLWIAFGRGRP
ncbi:SURF1 family protein [Sphingomonas sp. GB1N7]|uniref:SURF1 family protein n=1 Tax=Parasphingomonas caseinilytica TaxID=3096158 RepID=UPI002FC70850